LLEDYKNNVEVIQRYMTLGRVGAGLNGSAHPGWMINLNEKECITFQCTKSKEVLAIMDNEHCTATPSYKILTINDFIKPKTQYVLNNILANREEVLIKPLGNLQSRLGAKIVLDYDKDASTHIGILNMYLDDSGKIQEQTPNGLAIKKIKNNFNFIDVIFKKKLNPALEKSLFKLKEINDQLVSQNINKSEIASILYTNSVGFENQNTITEKITFQEYEKSLLVEKNIDMSKLLSKIFPDINNY
jgi:hypothetical protein